VLIAEFFVPGPPIAKGRPRVALRAGRPVAYTPDRTVRYESTVALIGAQAMDGRSPIAEPVELSVRAFFPIPQSWPKARRAAALAGELAHASRPDLDNVVKAVADGLAGICWPDDASVVAVLAEKTYSETPGVAVRVRIWQPAALLGRWEASCVST
jgi:Holliday junction resolvase RusA-like endonuclease